MLPLYFLVVKVFDHLLSSYILIPKVFILWIDLFADASKSGRSFFPPDLDELLSISDYISVMYRGKISSQIETNKLNRLKVGLMMAGENFNV